jgi:hypothetical protein
MSDHKPLRASQAKVFNATIEGAPHESRYIVHQEPQAAIELDGSICLLFCFHEYSILGIFIQ